MSITDWVTEEEAAEVIQLAESVRSAKGRVPISSLGQKLGISEDEVRTFVATVRQSHILGRSRGGRFLSGLWHLFIICVTAVVLYAAWSEASYFRRTAQLGTLFNGTLWLEIAWVALVATYYRHVLLRKLKRVFEGYRPSRSS